MHAEPPKPPERPEYAGDLNKLRDDILVRLQIEDEIKSSRSQPQPAATRRWWDVLNSGLGLLLLTTLLSSFLIPLFQKHQQDVDWRRQMRADNAKYHLGLMRQCLEDLSSSGTFTSIAYERIRPVLRTLSITDKEFQSTRAALIDLQERRFVQNAKVRALLVHFPGRKTIEPLVFDYNRRATMYMRQIETFVYAVHAQSAASKSKDVGGGVDLSSLSAELSEPEEMYRALDTCTREIFRQIEQEENRYENATF